MSRVAMIGVLNVFRESYVAQTLSATVKLEDGTELYYNPSPKSFSDLSYRDFAEKGTRRNNLRVSFTAAPDGSNPRAVREV